MLARLQKNFRYCLALVLLVLLAVGIRLQAAPLGSLVSSAAQEMAVSAPANSRVVAASPSGASRLHKTAARPLR